MAYTEIFIPDGDYCSDKNHLGCMFEKHEYDFHFCSLYNESIGTINDFKINGELRRAFKKCNRCVIEKLGDNQNGLIPD